MRLDGPRRTLAATIGTVLFMGAMAWASVPFYRWFCAVTGFGGTTGVAEAAPDHALEQEITIRFDASKDRGMPWDFRPLQREMTLKIGETGLAFYEAVNPTDRTIAGSATYNVAPYEAGGFFTKIDCFCFTEQVLEPGQRVDMPVTFYVDPEIVADRDAKYVHTITLSYTFYETGLPDDRAEAVPDIPQGTTPQGG
ncbi:cytochrome c oxidase assembly protein [Mangrovicoccus algicola]|uniref:Cytochrome c oxidase assembly protein CtaG n=1 Tax=Mangrovicoccus algicola TaxID=2771008 RepID=A0A8J7CJP6_9RHOB|nr:cytochrome c oxidase assembly protein [Mangrovicoccus algicola]MBE3637786.1 cytochrome c oxidase assembly protein [Mangrovicoccus algicola]